MDSATRFSPRLEPLEDRSLPNNLLGLPDALAGTPSAAGDGLAGLLSLAAPAPALSRASTRHAAAGHHAHVFPVQSHPYGATYGEWSARWWQYALSIPAAQSPFNDQTGANFTVGQSGKVWYLSGGIEITATGQPPPPGTLNVLNRTVHVPVGKALFFPILNSEQDNVATSGPPTNFTADQLRGFAAQQQNLAENMFATIDGHPVRNVAHFRVTSPVFSYTLPDKNIAGVPAQTVSPAVADGVFLMVPPLSRGHHTIHFGGDFGPGNFALDVTYHITVGHK